MNRKSFVLSILVSEKRLLTWVVSCIVLFLLPHLLLGQTSVTTDSTLTGDHVGNISIDASDITLDCAGNSVIGPGTAIDIGAGMMRDIGIYLNGVTEVTIKNCHVQGFEVGIRLFQSQDNKLKKNRVFDNSRSGFALVDSNDNELKKNTARHNDGNGFVLVGSDKNELEKNRARDNGRNGFNLSCEIVVYDAVGHLAATGIAGAKE